MNIAALDLKSNFLSLSAPLDVYTIKTWTPRRVTAIDERLRGTALMTIDLDTEVVTITSTHQSNPNLPSCREGPPTILKLVEGHSIAEKVMQDRINKARELVYAPSRKFMLQGE